MRLFLLPISTRRTLLYCQRINVQVSEQQTFVDKVTGKAARLWSDWERKDSGWQKRIVDLGNRALKRIPYEEWGLKSIPPLSARRREDEISGNEKVEVFFPPSIIPEDSVPQVLKTLGTEREGLHRSRMIYSFLGMPVVAPIALLPIIPNLPFFYLVFRAWSHWRALSGSKHIQLLVERDFIKIRPSKVLDALYFAGVTQAVPNATVMGNKPSSSQKSKESTASDSTTKETVLLDRGNSKLIAKALEIPELEIELDRALWQVETSLEEASQLQEGKGKIDKASARTESVTPDKDNR